MGGFMNTQKKNKINFWYTVLVTAIIIHSSSTLQASTNDEEDLSSTPHKHATGVASANTPLDMFLLESLAKRGFAFRTERTVLVPLTALFFPDLKYMYQNKDTDFISSRKEFEVEPSYEEAECLSQLQAFGNMSLEDKKSIKIYDYAVIVEDETATSVNFAGLFSISPPDEEGWAEYRFILRKECRGQKLGPEVMKAIYEKIIKDTINTYIKLIKYHDYGHPNALFIQNPDNLANVIPNPYAKAYTVNATVPFKGLQGWVHEDNKASISMNDKCGWIRSGSKVEKDLRGQMKEHYLYRSPAL